MPSKFVNIDPDLPADEDVQQAYVVQQLRRRGYLVHADSNGASKSMAVAQKQKVLGAKAGWPDLTIIMPSKIVFCELKTKNGRVRTEQVKTHLEMAKNGFNVEVVVSCTPRECFEWIMTVLEQGM